MITKKFNNIHELPLCSGIYSILNILNNHRYIGSTNNFKRRLTRHRSELKKGVHHSLYLQRAYNKYGQQAFVVQILEICQPIKDTLLALEQKYLDLKPEYNISTLANRPSDDCRKPLSEYTKNKIKAANIGRVPTKQHLHNQSIGRKGKGTRPVSLYDLKGNFISTFNSVCDAAVYVSGSYWNQSCIGRCCRGETCSAFGYLWKYEDDHRDIFEIVKKHKVRSKRSVVCLTKDGMFVKQYKSAYDAASLLGSKNSTGLIYAAIRGDRNSALGFKWKYKYDI